MVRKFVSLRHKKSRPPGGFSGERHGLLLKNLLSWQENATVTPVLSGDCATDPVINTERIDANLAVFQVADANGQCAMLKRAGRSPFRPTRKNPCNARIFSSVRRTGDGSNLVSGIKKESQTALIK